MVATIRPRWHHLVFFIGPALVLYTLFMAWPLLDSLRLNRFPRIERRIISRIGPHGDICYNCSIERMKHEKHSFAQRA